MTRTQNRRDYKGYAIFVGCVIALLLPSFLSSFVWGPINIVIHAFAVFFFVLICIIFPKLAVFTLPFFAIFLSFMPYFDWLNYVDTLRGAHWPRMDMVLAQLEWHLALTAWAAAFLGTLRFCVFRGQN